MAEVPDKATGLTPSEKEVVRKIWDIVKQDIAGNGYDLFIRFFTENPSYQQFFKSFKNVAIDELRGNKRVLAHATNVLYAITMLVDNLDDPEVLIEMLSKLAKNHFRRHIKIEHFQKLKISLLGLLKDKLGADLMNEKASEAWSKTYDVIASVIEQGLKDAENDID